MNRNSKYPQPYVWMVKMTYNFSRWKTISKGYQYILKTKEIQNIMFHNKKTKAMCDDDNVSKMLRIKNIKLK